jgi:hypothetical protein
MNVRPANGFRRSTGGNGVDLRRQFNGGRFGNKLGKKGWGRRCTRRNLVRDKLELRIQRDDAAYRANRSGNRKRVTLHKLDAGRMSDVANAALLVFIYAAVPVGNR